VRSSEGRAGGRATGVGGIVGRGVSIDSERSLCAIGNARRS
jgi:hypothetical protein